jgi:hypothetical protein
MTLIRLIQRASILAGMTFASIPFHSNSALADTPQICVIASNGKTECGTLKAVERACVTTDAGSTVCGKFKSAREGQEQEASSSAQATVARKEIDNSVFTLKGCRQSETTVKCDFVITNKVAEKRIYFYVGNSTLVDSVGKSHAGTVGDLGGISSRFPDASITPNVDYSASITFENMPVKLVKSQILNLNFGGVKPVQFRNVPISN